VIPCTKPPDEIIALKLFFDKDRNHHVCVGTKLGKLLDVNLTPDDRSLNGHGSVTSFNARSVTSNRDTTRVASFSHIVSFRSAKQQLTYNDMFDSNEYNLSGKLTHFITDPHYPELVRQE